MSRPSLTDPTVLPAIEHQRRHQVEDYDRMVEAGVFDECERLELLEGVIVEISPQTPRHARVVRRLCDPVFVNAGPAFVVQSQLPLRLSPDSEPEPDVAVIPRAEAESRDHHPATASLVFEVSGESLKKDRLTKAGVYAGAGIPEYVIANLVEECLEVHRDPEPAARRYRTVTTLAPGDRFESAVVPGFAFAIAGLLG